MVGLLEFQAKIEIDPLKQKPLFLADAILSELIGVLSDKEVSI